MNNFAGATLLALLLLVVLSCAALLLLVRRGDLRRSPLVLALACMGWLTPLIVFGLSKPPLNLPLFALRHVLPATVLLTLLCAYGLECLAAQFAGSRNGVMLAGSLFLISVAATPSAQVLHAGPARYPYDRMEKIVLAKERGGVPAYAVWYYGVGEPIDFYCRRTCVQKLPDADAALPARLVLLYRPAAKGETAVYNRLLGEGFTISDATYFTDGLHSPYGTTVATLERRDVGTAQNNGAEYNRR